METDPYGNFLTQGYELASGRDWARLGNLYLQDGVWNGERILPEGYVKFVSTLAPAWQADQRPVYGAFFWINGEGAFPVPREAYYMAGAGGQIALIVPSHDLVVVRLGHYRGGGLGFQSLQQGARAPHGSGAEEELRKTRPVPDAVDPASVVVGNPEGPVAADDDVGKCPRTSDAWRQPVAKSLMLTGRPWLNSTRSTL